MYKKTLKGSSPSKNIDNSKQGSNLIYVLFLPILLYSYKYFTTKSSNHQSNSIDSSTESLLTKPYPVSSIGSIDTFSTNSS